MIHEEFGWITGDGLKIFAQAWIPDTEVKAVVGLIHGLGEHSGRYRELPVELTNSGFALISYDQRGHGKSEGRRGHTPSYEALLKDISKLISEAEKRFSGKKLFLYGHSMGGNLVLNYALRNNSTNLSGIITTGPWLQLTRPLSPFMNYVAIILNKYFPSFRSFHGIKSTDLTNKKNKKPKTEIDELMHPWISVRTYISIRDSGLWALEHAANLTLPLLILHGSSDRVTSLEGSKLLVSRIKKNCTLRIVENLSHDIHNEPEREKILSAIIDWLNLNIN